MRLCEIWPQLRCLSNFIWFFSHRVLPDSENRQIWLKSMSQTCEWGSADCKCRENGYNANIKKVEKTNSLMKSEAASSCASGISAACSSCNCSTQYDLHMQKSDCNGNQRQFLKQNNHLRLTFQETPIRTYLLRSCAIEKLWKQWTILKTSQNLILKIRSEISKQKCNRKTSQRQLQLLLEELHAPSLKSTLTLRAPRWGF